MKKIFAKLDKPLFIAIVFFFVFGLIMILSSSSMESYMRYNYSPYHYFYRQIIFLIFGFILFFILLKIPTKVYKKIDKFLIIIGLASLVLLLKFGYNANNAVSWYKIKGITIQPSEFVKVFIIIYLACYYEKNKDRMSAQWNIFKPFLVVLLLIAFVFIQPDLGTALIMGLITLLMFYACPIAKEDRSIFNKIFLSLVLIISIVFISSGDKILKSYQLERFNYIKPCERYQEKSGYQLCNSFIAFKNGGLNGEGLGFSTQKYLYLPEAYTDFIFPIIVEELGLITGILVIFGYMFILFRIIKIARKSTNIKNALLCYGVFIYLLVHIVINLFGVTGLIPLTGVPLPFLSYGGSYTISLMLSLGLVERVAIENNTKKRSRI